MTIRQYAAIKLRVPDSGTDWLDDMIRKSNRDHFAAAALHGLCEEGHLDTSAEISQWAYSIADAMMERRKR